MKHRSVLGSLILAGAIGFALQPQQAYSQQINNDFSGHTIEQVAFGQYAVGAKVIFARNQTQRFDPWNTAYASSEYRQLLEKIEKSGQPRTVATHIWYPAKASSEHVDLNNRARNPLKAVSGTQAKISDYVLNDNSLYPALAGFFSPEINGILDKDGHSLEQRINKGDNEAYKTFTDELMAQLRGAFIDAPIADGQFPVIVLSHGLGGNFAMWDRAGEFLASHGYIVAAPTFISDGTVPIVFHDPASEYASTHDAKAIQAAYQTLSEQKVIPNFFKFLFDIDEVSPSIFQTFDPSKATVQPGGAEKMVEMQRNLFRQRISDVSTVIETLAALNADKQTCTALTSGSVTESCGQFSGHINTDKVGLSGHSLGSMTSQMGLEHIPNVDTAIGLNNGTPHSWEPQEIFGADLTKQGQPVGNTKPVLQLIGNEDAFVQGVFYTLSQQFIKTANGDSTSIMQLDNERATISKDNPQPVALSAYQRAIGDKMLVTIKDVNHGVLTQHEPAFNMPKYLQDEGTLTFRASPVRQRKATGNDLENKQFQGELFSLLDWAQTPEGLWFYKPHVIRDYYYLNWFDYYLKAQPAGLEAVMNAPFKATTHTRSEIN